MTLTEAKMKYYEVFGPVPIMVLLGHSEEKQKEMLIDAVKTGKELRLVDYIPNGAIV